MRMLLDDRDPFLMLSPALKLGASLVAVPMWDSGAQPNSAGMPGLTHGKPMDRGVKPDFNTGRKNVCISAAHERLGPCFSAWL